MDTTLECYTGLFTNCDVLSSRQNYYFQNPRPNPPLIAVLILPPSGSAKHRPISRTCRCHCLPRPSTVCRYAPGALAHASKGILGKAHLAGKGITAAGISSCLGSVDDRAKTAASTSGFEFSDFVPLRDTLSKAMAFRIAESNASRAWTKDACA